MHSEETKRKIGVGVSRASALGRRRPKGIRLTDEHRLKIATSVKGYFEKKLLSADFDSLTIGRKRARIVIEQKGRCACCGLGEWRGKPIVLELDHRKGRSERREDLWALCPNCHSQTENWRGRGTRRNSSGGKFKIVVSDDDLSRSLASSSTIRQALLSVGMCGEGHNYKRAKKLLEKKNAPVA